MNISIKPLVASAAALVLASTAYAMRVPGESLDSGLGALPHYSTWLDKTGSDPMRNSVPGESLDSGLGALPPYAQWWDKTGRDPMGITSAAMTPAAGR